MASHWQFKERISILHAKRLIHELREEYDKPGYRGPEYIWYTIWNVRLSRLVDKYRSLVVGPQRQVTHYPKGQDGEMKSESRIPDFAILRVFSKRLVKSDDGIAHMEFEKMKIVALLEVKPQPVDSSSFYVDLAIEEARADLVKQAEILFTGDLNCNAIIGIAVAGDRWCYEVFTIHNTTLRSKNVDATFREPDEQTVKAGPSLTNRPCIAPHSRRPVYQLGTPQSDAAMENMMEEIKKLRGFARYANTQF